MILRKSKWNLATKLIAANVSAILVMGAILSLVFISFGNIGTSISAIVTKDMPRVINNGHIGNELTGMFADLLIGVFYGQEDTVKAKSDRFGQTIDELDANPVLRASLDEFRPKLAFLLEQSARIRNLSEQFKTTEGDILFMMDMLQEIIAEHIEKKEKNSPELRYMEQLRSMGTRYREVFLEITVQVAEIRGRKSLSEGKDSDEHPVISNLNYFRLSLETLLSADSQIREQGRQIVEMTEKYKESVIRFLKAVNDFQKQIRDVSDSKDRFMTVLKNTNEQIADTAEDIRKRIDAGTQITRKILIVLSAGVLILSLLITYSVLNTFRVEGEAQLLAREMELAKKIQTVLLPKKPEISGYEIAASCEPADEVGGDYYDVISAGGFDWIVIGDVSGHGVTSGLVMMMVQTAIHTVLIQNPEVQPSRLLSVINRTIYENIVRMDEQKHMTILVIACGKDGFFDFSGLHEDILLWCAESRKVEKIETDGMWIGLEEDISGMLPVTEFRLSPGDCIVLYTDGIIEARGKNGEFFGTNRLTEIIRGCGDKTASEIHAEILQALKEYEKSDDVTLFVMKRV